MSVQGDLDFLCLSYNFDPIPRLYGTQFLRRGVVAMGEMVFRTCASLKGFFVAKKVHCQKIFFHLEIISRDKLCFIFQNICNFPPFSARLLKFENFCRLRKKEFPPPAGIRTGVSWVAGSYTSLYTMATDTIRRFI